MHDGSREWILIGGAQNGLQHALLFTTDIHSLILDVCVSKYLNPLTIYIFIESHYGPSASLTNLISMSHQWMQIRLNFMILADSIVIILAHMFIDVECVNEISDSGRIMIVNV